MEPNSTLTSEIAVHHRQMSILKEIIIHNYSNECGSDPAVSPNLRLAQYNKHLILSLNPKI